MVRSPHVSVITSISGTSAQFDAACTDDNFAFLAAANTFTGGDQVFQEDGSQLVVEFQTAMAAATGSLIRMQSSRGTIATPTTTQANDDLGRIDFRGHSDGDDTYATSVSIIGTANETQTTASDRGGAFEVWCAPTGSNLLGLQIKITNGDIDVQGNDISDAGTVNLSDDIVFTERADHASTPGAGFGYLWCKNTSPSTLIFTDDAGTDITVGTGSGDIATDSIWDAAGDLVYGTGADTAAKLVAGTNGDILHQASGIPAWTSTPDLGTPSAGILSNCTVASTTAKGVVELATQAEVDAGTDTERAVTPSTLTSSSVVQTFDNSPIANSLMKRNNADDGYAFPQGDANEGTGELRGGAGQPGTLELTTAELTVVATDILGRINFSAPLESDGTDAITLAASIAAVAEDTFAADNNDTAIVFYTGVSGAATEAIRIAQDGTNAGIYFDGATGLDSITATGTQMTFDMNDATDSYAFRINAGSALNINGSGTTVDIVNSYDLHMGGTLFCSSTREVTSNNVTIDGGATSAELRIVEPSGGGSSYTGFKAPALAGNVVYTLPVADGSSGQVLSTNASGVLSWATASGSNNETLIMKTADTSAVNNSTTLVDIDEFAVTLSASTLYAVKIFIIGSGGPTGDIKIGFTNTGGGTWTGDFVFTSFPDTANVTNFSGTMTYNLPSGSTIHRAQEITGFVETDGTGGDLKIQFAQNATEVVDTVVRKGSWLKVSSAT